MTKWILFNAFVNIQSIFISHKEYGSIEVRINSIQLEDGSGHCFNSHYRLG